MALSSAFVLGPKVLVLDDPLSAVDARTEAGILEAIDEQMGERSVVLITHRIAAARRCDRILVLEDGQISASGSHEELLESSPLYASFAEEQRIAAEMARLGQVELPAEEMQPTVEIPRPENGGMS